MLSQTVKLNDNGSAKVCGGNTELRFGYVKNENIYSVNFELSPEWEGLYIRVFWHVPEGDDPSSSLVVDGSVTVPPAVTAITGVGKITLEGTDGTKTITSSDVTYRVYENSGISDGTDPELGSSAWEQFVNEVKADADRAEASASAAKQSETASATSEANSKASENKSLEYMNAAKGYSESASSSAASSEASYRNALKSAQDAAGHASSALSSANESARILGEVKNTASTAQNELETAKNNYLTELSDAKASHISSMETKASELTEASKKDIESAKETALTEIDATNKKLPDVTADDACKSLLVSEDGTKFVLGDPPVVSYTKEESDARYAPIESAIRPTANGNPAVCSDSIAWSFQGLKIYGKSAQNGTPSLENPVPIVSSGDGGSVEIEISGANLLNPELFEPGFINETTGENQTYPTRTRTKGFIPITGNKLYVASVPATGDWTIYYFYDNNFSFLSKKSSSSIGSDIESFGIPKNSAFLRVSWFVSVDVISGTLAFASTANVPAQAFVEPQSLPLSTPTGLPGIPVDSDGNYTDAEGQQWVCDEIDCKNEAYIKNLTLIPDLSIGTFTKHVDGMFICDVGAFSAPHGNSKFLSRCTHFPSVTFLNSYGILVSSHYVIIGVALAETFDNVDDFNNFLLEQRENNTPVQLLYYQNESIEAPLSEDELAAYRALTTYPGTTVVSTAEPVAGIEARYVVDPQKYIEKYVDEKVSAAVSEAVTSAITLMQGGI